MTRNAATANQEMTVRVWNGWFMLVLLLACFFGDVALLIRAEQANKVFFAIILPVIVFLLVGLFSLQPNEARVLVLFGAYKGTVRESGFHWGNPLYSNGPLKLGVQEQATGRKVEPGPARASHR